MKTTLEEAKEYVHDTTVSNLQGLLKKNYEAEEGFKAALKNAQSDPLKGFLKEQAAQRSRFVNELDNEIRSMNEDPVASGSVAAQLHRTWIDVKTSFAGDTDEAVLEECITGEKSSWNAYEETIKENNFTPEVTSMLQRQASEIKETLKSVKRMEDVESRWS